MSGIVGPANNRRPRAGSAAAVRPSSYDLERREVLDSILEAVRQDSGDEDTMAACAYLARHLFRGGTVPPDGPERER